MESMESAANAVGRIQEIRQEVMTQMHRVIVGHDTIIDHLLTALITSGHVLLEGVPGTAKTLMVKTLAHIIQADFKRIQFTPDLMPSDIVGTNVFDLRSNRFELAKGPVFTDLLLGDEINRAPAKTQSALLEAMEEKHVSIDGTTYDLSSLFTVFATQNPIESEGTYPLPEAQLDRFLIKALVPYPTADDEERILTMFNEGFDSHNVSSAGVTPSLSPQHIEDARKASLAIRVEPQLISYIRKITHATRDSHSLIIGAGPRASIHLLLTSKVVAALRHREFVTPDDVRFMAYPVLRHRIILEPEVEIDGATSEEVIEQLLGSIEVPR